MAKRIINIPQQKDSGSEAGVGFDFQWHIAARKCIEMLTDRSTEFVICEFHEDIVQVRRIDYSLDLSQVKKKEIGNWTLNDLLKPESKGEKGILAKLLEKIQIGKDVHSLSLIGYGRCSGNDDYSLPELIALLSTPEINKDDEWKERIEGYTDHISDKLEAQEILTSTVSKALNILKIDFSYPHPNAIEGENQVKLEEFVRLEFQVELSLPEIKEVYRDLFDRVKKISLKPKQSWDVKSISKDATSEMIYKRLRQYRALASRDQYQTLQDKLTSAGLEEKVSYARECRTDALILKYELNIKSLQWKKFKADINVEWHRFREANPYAKGADLWKAIMEVFDKLGDGWKSQDPRLGSDFAEGVFFEMTAICEAKWRI